MTSAADDTATVSGPDYSRHYAEGQRWKPDGTTYTMAPYCPRCGIGWPCPTAVALDLDADGDPNRTDVA